MELTIKNLKEEIFNTLGKDIINEGFLFNKSTFEFVRKDGKNKAKLYFLFNNFQPLRIEFHYSIVFKIFEINKETKSFLGYLGRVADLDTKTFREGDFHPDTKDKENKYRADFYHKVNDINHASKEIEVARKLWKDDFVPMLPIYTNFEKFQDYVLNNYKLNFSDEIPFLPTLISAKLKSYDILKEVVSFYWNKMQMDNKPETDFTKKILVKITEYAG